MINRYLKFTSLLLFLFLGAMVVFGATTGKIVGKVLDENEKPVADATVMVAGTGLGAFTDEKGEFVIINVPIGDQKVSIRKPGFSAVEINDVAISMDMTTDLEAIEMTTGEVTGKVIEITADRKRIQRDETSSNRKTSSETIEKMANVTNVADVVASQAGVVKSKDGSLHVRGGRSTEVLYLVNGVEAVNPLNNGQAIVLSSNSLAAVDVMTGGFSAEYGGQSGAVNQVMKSGGKDYSGRILYSTDNVIEDYSFNSDKVYFSFGGPLIPGVEHLNFFFDIEAHWTDQFASGVYKPDLLQNSKLVRTGPAQYEWSRTGDKRSLVVGEDTDFLGLFDIQRRMRNLYTGSAKVSYKFGTSDNPTKYKIAYNIVYNDRAQHDYSSADEVHSNRYNVWNSDAILTTPGLEPNTWDTQVTVYNSPQILDHIYEKAPYYDRVNTQHIFEFQNTISSSSVYSVKASYLEINRKKNARGESLDFWGFDPEDTVVIADMRSVERYERDENGNPVFYANQAPLIVYFDDVNYNYVKDEGEFEGTQNAVDPETGNQHEWVNQMVSRGSEYYLEDGVYWRWNDYTAKTFSVKFDYINQLNKSNELKTGFNFKYHDVDYSSIDYPWYENPQEPDEMGLYREVYQYNPLEANIYINDKLEFEGMIVNAGLRVDYLTVGDEFDDQLVDPNNPNSPKVIDINRNGEIDFDEKHRVAISPRLGISYPVSENDVMHLSYNHQDQNPSLFYILQDAQPEAGNSLSLVGNPALKSTKTITYEIGLKHVFNDDWMMDATFFYKNIYDMLTTEKVPFPGEESTTYHQYTNGDYGSVSGLDFIIDKRLSSYYTASIAYTYSFANGRGSTPGENYAAADEAIEAIREYPLDWDVRHHLKGNLSFVVPVDEPIFDVPGFDNFRLDFASEFRTGEPYTPLNIFTGTEEEKNSKRKPNYFNTDMKFTKSFKLGESTSFGFFVQVLNLFDRRNTIDVHPLTGEAWDAGCHPIWDDDPEVRAKEEMEWADWEKVAYHKTEPRNVIFGFSFAF